MAQLAPGLTFDILFSIELSLRITAEGRLFLKAPGGGEDVGHDVRTP